MRDFSGMHRGGSGLLGWGQRKQLTVGGGGFAFREQPVCLEQRLSPWYIAVEWMAKDRWMGGWMDGWMMDG